MNLYDEKHMSEGANDMASNRALGSMHPDGVEHADDERHHGHSHASNSVHANHHHLLQVSDLSVSFRRYDGGRGLLASRQREVEVLRKLTVSVHAGEIVAVVGASGAGKSLLADCVLGLFDPHAVVSGRIWFDGVEQTAESLARLRGNEMALVPQSIAGLDPLMKVGEQVIGSGATSERAERERRQKELFARYGLSPEVAQLYPFQLSGGMARRVLLCCALIDDPRLIVADEPTVGLDRELALSALADFRSFSDEGGGVMLITHDIELALQVADRVAIFRDGTVVEETAVVNFASPELLETEYARALWHALPEHDFAVPHALEVTRC